MDVFSFFMEISRKINFKYFFIFIKLQMFIENLIFFTHIP